MENKDLSVMSVLVFGEHHRHQEVTLLKLNSCASKCIWTAWDARGIERVTEMHHTTIIDWVREAETQLPEDEEADPIKVAELDELQTFFVSKKQKVWIWTALNHYQPGILAITVGDRSGKTISKLWGRVEDWDSKWYITDGYYVYANFIDPSKHLIMKKTKMTRVEGKNTRLRHYLGHWSFNSWHIKWREWWDFSHAMSPLPKPKCNQKR